MSITDTINNIKTQISQAYTEINQKDGEIPTKKNILNLARSISSIPYIKQLWCGGNNPILIEKKEITINLANDTTFSSKTPSTTMQTITNSTINIDVGYITYNDTLNDYVVVIKGEMEYKYTDTPVEPYIDKYAFEGVYNCGQFGYAQTMNTPQSIINPLYITLYKSGGVTKNYDTSEYGIYFYPKMSSTFNVVDGKFQVRMMLNNLYLRNSTTYMNIDNYSKIDTQNTNMKVSVELYKVSKNSSPIIKLQRDFYDNL